MILNEKLRKTLMKMKSERGVISLKPLTETEKKLLLEEEMKLEDRGVLSMCKSLNLGLREALKREFTVALVLNTSKFEYPHHPHVKMICGGKVVGEEIFDEKTIAELKRDRRNLFLWKNFVLYYDKIPRKPDERKTMRLVYLPREAPLLNGVSWIRDAVLGIPSPEGDLMIKRLLKVKNQRVEVGSCVVGFNIDE